jgi:hypothetical protein
MPIPGPRTQFGAVPGYRNPPVHSRELGSHGVDRIATGPATAPETPGNRVNRFEQGPQRAVVVIGRTPGVEGASTRGNVLGAGTIRNMWRQSVNVFPAQGAVSWTSNVVRGRGHDNGVGITRSLRYLTRMLYMGSGIDNSRYGRYHTTVKPNVRSKAVTQGSGSNRNRPTVRNRMTSFGSRVPPLNAAVPGAESGDSNG